ncbi:MAG: hypothetical protein AMJ94_14510 [Deltaproteobacteria bacterium SM23_61]|nr:MAG: hypothetical protein AMJ94_14510 [Deltaproteobacteria bacterium SM23_61]
MKKDLSPSPKAGLLVLIFLLLLVLVPFLPVLWSGGEKVLSNGHTDIAGQFYAYKHFLHEEIGRGRLPLWNPYLMSGTDFLGEGQPALFYPTTWILALFSPATAINLHFLLHSWLLAASLYYYLRELGLGRESAFFGGLIFVFSSVPVLRIYPGHLPNYPALALAPLFLLFWERYLKKRGRRSLLFLSLIYAGLIFSGHAQFLLYFSIFFLFYAGWTIWTAPEVGRKGKGIMAIAFCLSLLLGVLLSSAHLLPAADFARNSFRQQMSYEFCSRFSFAPENFLTLLYPSFFGDRVVSAYWGRNYLWEMTAYLGIFPLLLAFLGARSSTHPRRLFWVIAAGVFSLLALGRHTPLFYVLYHFVPFFDKFRGNSKFITLVVLSLSILAALGLEGLLSGQKEKLKRPLKKILKTTVLLSLGLVLISGLLFAIVSGADAWKETVKWRYTKGEIYEKPILDDQNEMRRAQATAKRSIAITLLFALAATLYFGILSGKRWKALPGLKTFLFLGIVGDLFFFGWKYYDSFPVKDLQPPREVADFLSKDKGLFRVLAPSLPHNSFMLSPIESIGGYAGNILERYNRFLNRSQGKPEDLLQNVVQVTRYSPAFHLLNIKYIILPSRVRLGTPDFHRLFSSGDLTIYQNRLFVPRIYFPQRVRFIDSPATALNLAAQGGFDPRQLTLLEDRVRQGETIDYGAAGAEFKLLKHAPNEIHLRVQVSQPRFLVVANSFDPRWKASLDGMNAIPLVPANYVLQATLIPEGSHLLKIYFFPDSLEWGILLTAAGLLAWAFLWIWGKGLGRFL